MQHHPLQSPLIQLDQVSRSFGSLNVLRDVSFAIYPGETVAVIGESGCGKSVTLKLMMALMRPDRGRVYWGDRNVASIRGRQLSRQRLKIGYLFQNAALFDSLDVYENISFGLRQNTKLPERTIREIVHARLVDVGLGPNISRHKPAELSGGMRKRVALARALALTPEVMFYDEPTTGLDPVMSDVINELILRTRENSKVTSIVVTHDMRTVEKVADRIIMLYPLSRLPSGEQQVIFTGTPQEAWEANDPRIANFLRGEAGTRLAELMLS